MELLFTRKEEGKVVCELRERGRMIDDGEDVLHGSFKFPFGLLIEMKNIPVESLVLWQLIFVIKPR